MMTGSVFNRHLLLPVTLRLPGQPNLTLAFVIDTGFTDFLTLPPAAVAALRLPFLYDLPINLANNTNDIIAVHQATILWHGVERDVSVFAAGKRPLLGMVLLEGGEFVARIVDGSTVKVSL